MRNESLSDELSSFYRYDDKKLCVKKTLFPEYLGDACTCICIQSTSSGSNNLFWSRHGI